MKAAERRPTADPKTAGYNDLIPLPAGSVSMPRIRPPAPSEVATQGSEDADRSRPSAIDGD
jgi:hypothetical protein